MCFAIPYLLKPSELKLVVTKLQLNYKSTVITKMKIGQYNNEHF